MKWRDFFKSMLQNIVAQMFYFSVKKAEEKIKKMEGENEKTK